MIQDITEFWQFMENATERGTIHLGPRNVLQIVRPRRMPDRAGIYSFAIGDEPMYFGHSAKSASRPTHYADPRPPGEGQQSQAWRIYNHIVDALAGRQRVELAIMAPTARKNGLALGPTRDDERLLIERFRPEWNQDKFTYDHWLPRWEMARGIIRPRLRRIK